MGNYLNGGVSKGGAGSGSEQHIRRHSDRAFYLAFVNKGGFSTSEWCCASLERMHASAHK
jgi:hypothetical protein